MTVEGLINYILSSKTDRFNIHSLADKFDINERNVREAFYELRNRGVITLRKDDEYILINNNNIEHYRDEVEAMINKQRKTAMTSIIRYNNMIKSLPASQQLWEEI